MYHAFIDESVRAGRYLLTAVLVPSRDLARVTRQVREVFPKGNRRTHFSAENHDRRRRLLKAYVAIGAAARVVTTEYNGGSDEPARRACLSAIVARAEAWQVGMLVLDSRGVARDQVDRRSIVQAIKQHALSRELQYTHRGSRDEPLLCLPDAIGWAVGAGREWRQLVRPSIAEIVDIDAKNAEPGGSSNGGEHRANFRPRERPANRSIGKRRTREQA